MLNSVIKKHYSNLKIITVIFRVSKFFFDFYRKCLSRLRVRKCDYTSALLTISSQLLFLIYRLNFDSVNGSLTGLFI